jgi:CRP-like cAMP-binding protein
MEASQQLPLETRLLGLDTANLPKRDIAAGAYLFRQNDRASGIFQVISGQLRLERHSEDGRQITLQVAGPGGFLAEASLFGDRYHCDALALKPTQVRVFPKQDLLRAIAADPTSGEGLLAHMARQLQDLRLRAELRSVRSAKRRVMLYVEHIADSDGIACLPGTLQDTAADLGLTREAFYRTVAVLEKEGAIARQGTVIRIAKSSYA